mgnify:CR=1 FL=1
MVSPSTSLPLVEVFPYGEHRLTLLRLRGRVWVVSTQVARMLGYSRVDVLGSLVTKKWSREFIQGHDWEQVTGPELNLLKVAVELASIQSTDHPTDGQTPRLPIQQMVSDGLSDLISPNTKGLILLTRSGLDMVLLKTNKEAGVALRRWLVDQVFPALREKGFYGQPLTEGQLERTREKRHRQREARRQREAQSRLIRDLNSALRIHDLRERQTAVIALLELLPSHFKADAAARIASSYHELLMGFAPRNVGPLELPLDAAMHDEIALRAKHAPRQVALAVLASLKALDGVHDTITIQAGGEE